MHFAPEGHDAGLDLPSSRIASLLAESSGKQHASADRAALHAVAKDVRAHPALPKPTGAEPSRLLLRIVGREARRWGPPILYSSQGTASSGLT